MIQKNEPISSTDFKKGLVTRSDILKPDPEQSPNCMDIKWYFDGAIGKRAGASTTNSVTLGSTGVAGWVIDSNNSLSTSIQAYWKLDEASGTRNPAFGSISLSDFNNNVGSITGIRGAAASYVIVNSNILYSVDNSSLEIGTGNFSISAWYWTDTLGVITAQVASKRGTQDGLEWQLSHAQSGGIDKIFFVVGSGPSAGINVSATLVANSFGALNTSTWYNVIAWHSNNSHIGVSVNLSVNTMAYTTGVFVGTANFYLGSTNSGNQVIGRIDEVGIWNKVLSAQERSDLYGGGSGNTFTNAVSAFGWAMFDFGATSIRWLTVAQGTGLIASSNLGTTFVNIASSRTQTYQYLDRSKNVLIATSDAYDVPLYWAGSTGTFAATLAPGSAPGVKYSINYQGFLVLLNSATRKRGFFYADENLQLTDPWTNSFDFPSSADDEVTTAFVLYKFLYVSTRYKLFRVAFVGGNPDWSFLKVKDFGFVPRTAKLMTVKGGQVVVGMDWQRRIRIFDGYDDVFASDNVENFNGINPFAMTQISYAGSGLVVSHAEADLIEQEYRLNVAIGMASTQVTHAIVLNGRTLAMYPYSNQNYQAMCIAESNNQQHLMAIDRSGFVHILNSGNLDISRPINENYDSPILFKDIPGSVSKSQNNSLYFKSDSCGVVYYQDALNRSTTFSAARSLVNLVGNENVVQVEAPLDVPATFNTYQFRLLSSSGTANPWKMTRWDFLQNTKGIGKG